MKKLPVLMIALVALIGLGLAWNAMQAKAVPELAPDAQSVENQDVLVSRDTSGALAQLISQIPLSVNRDDTGLLQAYEQPVPTNTPAVPGVLPTNTPAAPVENAVSGVQQIPVTLDAIQLPVQKQSSGVGVDHAVSRNPVIQQSLEQVLRQGTVRLQSSTPKFVAMSPSEICVDVLANSKMDVLENGDGTGNVDSWTILAQIVYYSTVNYNSPDYSLMMMDETNGSDTTVCPSGDCDFLGQVFKAPTGLTSLTIKYSRLYVDENATDQAGYELYVINSDDSLTFVDGWSIGATPTGWSNRQGTLDVAKLGQVSGQTILFSFYMLSDSTAPGEKIYLDDAQITVCYATSGGSIKSYLPLTLKQPPQQQAPTCSPVEPDNRDNRGLTMVGATCGGSFGPNDDKDYYTLDLKGVTNIRLSLTNLPSGSNYDAMIYEDPYVNSSSLACHIGTPGDQDKSKDCTLNLSKNYFVLVNAGSAPSNTKTYNMSVLQR